MTKEPTLQNIAGGLQTLTDTVQALATHLDEQNKQLRSEMNARFSQVDEKIDAQGKELRAEMATQGKELREEMRSMGQELRAEIGLSQKKSEVGVAALNSRFGRMETFMTKVAKKLDMDFQPS